MHEDYNVCGMVGVDKQRSGEDLVSMCSVYSEEIMMREGEKLLFFRGGGGGGG